GKTKADFDALVGAALASAVVPHAAPAPMLKRSVTSTPVAAAIAALRVSPEGFLLSPLKRICPSLDVVGNSAYMAVSATMAKEHEGQPYLADEVRMLRSDGELLRITDPGRFKDPRALAMIEGTHLALDRPHVLGARSWDFTESDFSVTWYRDR